MLCINVLISFLCAVTLVSVLCCGWYSLLYRLQSNNYGGIAAKYILQGQVLHCLLFTNNFSFSVSVKLCKLK